MVRPMKPAEEPAVMHQPVGPVKPGVVQQDGDADGDPKPRPAVGANPPVKLRPSKLRELYGDGAAQGKDEQREKRKANFTAHFRRCREMGNDLSVQPAIPKKHVTQQPEQARAERIAQPEIEETAGSNLKEIGNRFQRSHGEQRA